MCERQVVIVTGSTRGIGLHLTQRLIEEGYHVIGVSRTPVDTPREHYSHYALDVTVEAEVRSFVYQLQRARMQVYGLINNAGVAAMNAVLLTPMKSVDKVMSVNFNGTFLMCREVSKLMVRQREGRIVNLGTVAVPLKLEGEAVYVASKAAVISFTQVLAKELAPYGITCNVVSPGPIMTDLLRNVPQEKINMLLDQMLSRACNELEDVHHIVRFFLQQESRIVTAQVINLGGV